MKCEYCGNNEAQTKIPNPNSEPLGKNDSWEWNVCIPCKKIINLQAKLSLLEVIKTTFNINDSPSIVRKYNRLIRETKKQIDHISAEDGQKTFRVVLRRKGHG